MPDCNCIDCQYGKPDVSDEGVSRVGNSHTTDNNFQQIFAVCEVLEQGLLNSPIAAYSNIEDARYVAAKNSNKHREFAIVDIPFYL